MNTRETLVRNTLWYALVTGTGLVAGLLMSVILARGLGPDRMGEYSYLLWVSRTMAALATLGYTLATTRYTADALGRGDGARAGAFLTLFLRRQFLTTLAVALALLPFVLTLAPADLLLPLLVMTIGLFPQTLEGIYSQAAFGAQRYDITTQTSTLKMSLHLLTAIVAMALGADILGLVIGTTLGTVASCLVQRRRVQGLYPDRSASITDAARQELRAYLVPLSVVVVLDAVLWDRSEIFFLRLYASSAEIAFYSVAFGLAGRTMLAAEVAIGALLPALAALHGRGNREEFNQVYRAAIRWVALVGVPLAAVGTAVSPALITLLYGEPYRAVAALLGPLMLTALLGVMRHVAWTALWASGDKRWALASTWVSVVVKVGAAVLLIPALGAWGAVWSNAAAQLTASTLAFAAVTRKERCAFPLFDVGRIMVAGLAAFACASLLPPDDPHPGHLLAAGAAGLGAFTLAAIALGALGRREWALLNEAVARVPRRITRIALGSLGVILLVALYAHVATDLVGVWSAVPYYSYGFLVPVFAGWLLWDARRQALPAAPAWSARGLIVIGVGLALRIAGGEWESLTLQALSLPIVLLGLAEIVLGRRRAGAVAFALGFLVFMAPLPDGAIPALSLPLQELAAWFAAHVLPAVGIPTMREGLLLHLPDVTLHVTEACNGLRFLLAMTVVGTAFAWTTQVRLGRRVAVFVLAVAVAIAANLVRVAGTGVLVHHWGPNAVMGFFHVVYGKVVYLVMFMPFLAGVLMLRRTRLRSATDAA